MPAASLRHLSAEFAVRVDSVRLLMVQEADTQVRLCAGTSDFGETLYFVEDGDNCWLFGLSPDGTKAGVDRLDQVMEKIIWQIAHDGAADPASRDYVVQYLRDLPLAVEVV